MDLYAELTLEIPPRYVTPSTTLATAALSYVLANTTAHLRLHGPSGLKAACERWLEQAQADVQRRLQHASFE